MIILNKLKKWSNKSSTYIGSRELETSWFLLANPRLYPLKINSSNFVLLKHFDGVKRWHIFVELAKCCAKLCRLIFSNCLYFKRKAYLPVSTNAGVAGLIISHRILGLDDQNKCPYFGFLFKAFQNSKIEVDMRFINQCSHGRGEKDLNCVGDFKFELRLVWFAACEFYSVMKHCFTDLRFSVFLLGGCFTNSVIDSFRIAMRVEELLNKNNDVRFVLHTLEGHEWEHCLIARIRRFNKDVKMVGFQQAPINITSRAIFDLLLKFCPPDFILCSGKYSAGLFTNVYNNERVFMVGTNRSFGGNLHKNRRRNFGRVLVVPEGLITEVQIFLSYVKEVSEQPGKFKFLFTLHPTMTEGEFHAEVERYGVSGFVELAKVPLAEVAKTCHCVLFRGSTAVVEAVRNGCLPIFVQDRFGTCVNIFEQCNFKGLTTNHGSELKHIVKEKIEFKQFYEVSNLIFAPFDEKQFSQLKIW